jgi:hypothetical protein
MPNGNRRRRSFSRKRKFSRSRSLVRKRRRTPYKPKNQLTRYLGGFGEVKLVRLRYVENISINPTTTNSSQWSFRANSIFDPNFTGVGHQPNWHDTYSGLYREYTVLGAKCVVQEQPWGVNATQQTNTPFHWTVLLLHKYDNFPVTMTETELLENNVVKAGRVKQANMPYDRRNYSNTTLKTNFSAKKFFRISKDVSSYEANTSIFGTNPAAGAYFTFIGFPVDGTDGSTAVFRFTIEYIVLMKKLIAQTED